MGKNLGYSPRLHLLRTSRHCSHLDIKQKMEQYNQKSSNCHHSNLAFSICIWCRGRKATIFSSCPIQTRTKQHNRDRNISRKREYTNHYSPNHRAHNHNLSQHVINIRILDYFFPVDDDNNSTNNSTNNDDTNNDNDDNNSTNNNNDNNSTNNNNDNNNTNIGIRLLQRLRSSEEGGQGPTP